MTDLKLAVLNAGEKDSETNAPVAEAFVPMRDDATDESARIPIGRSPMMCALGLTAMPWAPDESGHAEAIVAENVGGLPGVVIASWDTRAHAMCANLKPGDVVVHSVGPNQAAQLQLKEGKRQVVLSTTHKDKKEQLLIIADGNSGKIQILANGAMWEINKQGETNFCSPNGQNGITVSNKNVWIRGEVLLGGSSANPAQCIMLGPITGSPGGPASVPLLPAQGVSIGM